MARPRPRRPNPFTDAAHKKTTTAKENTRKSNVIANTIVAWSMGLLGLSTYGIAIGATFQPVEWLAGIGLLGFFGWVNYTLGKEQGKNEIAVPTQTEQPDLPETQPPDNHITSLLTEARSDLGEMSGLVSKLPNHLRLPVKELLSDGYDIVAAVKDDPDKLAEVLRFFTYYLPSTAELLKDRTAFAAVAGTQRTQEIDQMLVRLVEAFEGFRQSTLEPELASIDLEIGLLDDALTSDFENAKTR